MGTKDKGKAMVEVTVDTDTAPPSELDLARDDVARQQLWVAKLSADLAQAEVQLAKAKAELAEVQLQQLVTAAPYSDFVAVFGEPPHQRLTGL